MWKTVCCQVQGSGHRKNDIPCQDKTFAAVIDGVHVIALADGAGSALLSHFGAERTAEEAARYLAEHFEECLECSDAQLVREGLMRAVLSGLVDEAVKHCCSVTDLASTILVAAADDTNYIVAHVGDGVIGYLDGQELKVASAPDNGEFANVTTFVTSSQAIPSTRLFKGRLKDKHGFVLMSDGTEQSLYHKPTKTLASVIVKLMYRTCTADEEELEEQLRDALANVVAGRTHDDCSIAILARHSDNVPWPDEIIQAEQEVSEGRGAVPARNPGKDARFGAALRAASKPRLLGQMARRLNLTPRSARKYLEKLVSRGLLARHGRMYSRR